MANKNGVSQQPTREMCENAIEHAAYGVGNINKLRQSAPNRREEAANTKKRRNSHTVINRAFARAFNGLNKKKMCTALLVLCKE